MTNLKRPDDSLFRPNSLTIGAILASLAFIMELALLPLILSAIKTDLALSVVGLAWVFNGYAIAVALAVLCGGLVGDVLDKRKLFMFGVALFAFGSLLSAFSGEFRSLLLSRILQGIGGGLFFPLVPVLLTQANAQTAGKILMIWGGLAGIAAALLPILGTALLAAFGWPAVFFAFSVVSSLALLFVAFVDTSNDGDESRRPPDYRQLPFIRGYWLLLFYIFLTYGCFSFYLFHFTVTWHDDGFTDLSVSMLLLCVWITFAAFNFLLSDRIQGNGLNRSIIAAPMLIGLSFLVAEIDGSRTDLQALSAVLIGAGLACCNSPSTHLLLSKAPKDLQAMSSSLDIIFARCGSVVTVAMLAAVTPFWVSVAVLALALVATTVAVALARVPQVPD